MTVENHSPSPIHLASIGLALPPEGETPRGLWLTRDIMGRPNAGGRIEPGDRYDFMFAEADLPTEQDGEPVLCVEATDRIGRHFRSNEAEFAKLAAELAEVRKKVRKPPR